VMSVVAFALMGALLAPRFAIGGVVSPGSLAIVVVWLGGLFIINRERKVPHWQVDAHGSSPGRKHRRDAHPDAPPPYGGRTTAVVGAFFGAACLVTLAAGVALEETGNELATRAGVNGVVFGATVLAAASALPEISSGIAAVRLGDNALAVGDIFGGNAFQLCLFLVADIVAMRPVLPYAGDTNAWLGALGIALTAIYCFGMISRPEHARLRIGPDSWLAVVVFGLGTAGLFALR